MTSASRPLAQPTQYLLPLYAALIAVSLLLGITVRMNLQNGMIAASGRQNCLKEACGRVL